MPEVFIDGEKVELEGTLPATLGELRDLLERALGEGGRVLAALSIDAGEYSDESAGVAFSADSRVEAVSISVEQARKRMAAETMLLVAEAQREVDVLAGEVLRVPWSEAMGHCIRAAETMSSVLQGAAASSGGANAAGPVASAAEALGQSLERWMDAVLAADAAALCLCSETAVLPALARMGGALASAVAEGAGA